MGLTAPPCEKTIVQKPKSNIPDGFNGKPTRKMDLTFATWNIRTMLQPGKMAEIADQMIKFNIDAVALQEVRWNGQGRIDKRSYSMYYSGADVRNGRRGVGFMISKKIRDCVLLFEPINDRICKIRLKGKFRNVSLISVYAPTEDSDDDEKMSFYLSLERALHSGPNYDIKIVLGDLNAQVGKETFTQTVAGMHSIHSATNENGKYLCQFAESNNLLIKSTCYPHKNIHKGTWKAPNGVLTQIDHVLVTKRHASSITDVRTARGPDCDSDHYLVKIKFRERLSHMNSGVRAYRRKWNLDKLKDPDKLVEFKEYTDKIIIEELARCEDMEDIEGRWSSIKKAIEKSAEEVIGERERGRGEDWFDNDCLKALNMRNGCRLAMLQHSTRLNCNAYQTSRKEAKKIIRTKKRAFLKKEVEQIEELRINNETRKFYGAVKRMNRSYQPKLENCKDKQGKIIGETAQVVDRWAEHFSTLLNANNDHHSDVTLELTEDTPDDIEPPMMDDVIEAIERLKNNKAPGEDLLAAEFFKNMGETLLNEVYDLIMDIWRREQMPVDWGTSLICPIFKKGDKLLCNNYRGISLLDVAYKIFSNILLSKISLFAENILDEYQCGFRRGRGTIDQIFVMRQIFEKCWEYKVNLHMLFIDFRQAFDSIVRDNLFNALIGFRVPSKLIRLVRMTLKNSNAKVLVSGKVSHEFPITSGVRQGDALSATLFNLALHDVIRKLDINGDILHSTSQICAYADDVCLIARSLRTLKENFKTLKEESEKMGLQVNEGKTKYMCISADNTRTVHHFEEEGYKFESVASFTYLGADVNNENKILNEVNKRIMAGNRAYFANIKLFRSPLLSRTTKKRLYKTLVRPVVTYASESWTLNTTITNNLKLFERKVLRRIYGPVMENGVWRIRTNREIADLYNENDIVKFIKVRRIEWLGHVWRMRGERTPKKVMQTTVYGTRRRGRPRRRWIQDVEEDLIRIGVRNWKEKALLREEWDNVVREARAHPGL